MMIAPPLSRKSSYYNRVMVLYASKVRNWGDPVSRTTSGKHPGSRVCMPSPGLQAWQVILIHNRCEWMNEWVSEWMNICKQFAAGQDLSLYMGPVNLLCSGQRREGAIHCPVDTEQHLWRMHVNRQLPHDWLLLFPGTWCEAQPLRESQPLNTVHCAQISQIPLWVTSSLLPQSLVASLLKLSPAKAFLGSLQS